MVFYLPGIVPGRKFIAIALKVLRANLVKDARNRLNFQPLIPLRRKS